MRKAVTYAVVLMWAALLLGGSFRPATAGGGAPGPEAGHPAPPLTVIDREGNPVSLADLRGKAVFLNFWASWCPPCRTEMPEIQRLAADLPEDAVILAVNVTTQERSPDAVWAFLDEAGYTFPVGLDLSGQASRDYLVVSLPTSLFINRDGVITARINGPLSYKAMAGYLEQAGR